MRRKKGRRRRRRLSLGLRRSSNRSCINSTRRKIHTYN